MGDAPPPPVGRYAVLTQRLVDAVLGTPGDTSPELRRTIMARAARFGIPPADALPAPLSGYLEKVTLHAYKVTDEDVAGLRRTGSSDDALFEATVSAAVGAALGRLERGLAALRGEEPD